MHNTHAIESKYYELACADVQYETKIYLEVQVLYLKDKEDNVICGAYITYMSRNLKYY